MAGAREVTAARVLGGRYRLDRLLGRGGMAEVWSARDQRLRREVAVKLLRPEMAVDESLRHRFEAEAHAAASLSHPNAVSVFDTGDDDGTAYIVMERLPGETLADRMAAGAVDEAWLRRVAGDVLGALQAAHDVGLVHRDVKPANILIAADGCAKVADFGIAKTVEVVEGPIALTRPNFVVGTPAYLAPERLDGQPATPRSDTYSLGVVLYEALAGEKPFAGTTPIATALAIHTNDVVPLSERRPDVDATFAEVVARAMARDPEARFPSASHMAAALDVAPPNVVLLADPAVDATNIDATNIAATILAATTTSVMPAVGAAELGSWVEVPDRAGIWWQRRREIAIALAVLAVILLLLALGGRDRSGSEASSLAATTVPSTTEAPPPAAGSLTDQLEAAAAGLSPEQGDASDETAAGLRSVAEKLRAGDTEAAADEASDLLAELAELVDEGELDLDAALVAGRLLATVPGVDVSGAVPTDRGDRGEGKGRGKGKGKGKGDD